MKFHLLHVYTLLSLALVGSQALNPEVYWNSVLPKTHMPTAIKELLYTKAWNDGMEKVTRNTASRFIKLNGQPEQSYSYVKSNDELKDNPHGASKDKVKDQPQSVPPFFTYGASNDEVQDHPQSVPPLFVYGASNDEVKDHPQSVPPLFVYGVSNDEVKDHPQSVPPLFVYGASNDEVKDHPQSVPPFFTYGVSNDEVKDHPQSVPPFFTYGASNDEVKDHPQSVPPLFVYGTSNDEVKDHPQSVPPLFVYGASNDKVKDHPQSVPPFFTYGASNDEVKDHPQSVPPFFTYGASNDEVKDHPQSVPPFFTYGASNDEVKDHPQSVPPFFTYGASNDEVKHQQQSSKLVLYGGSNQAPKEEAKKILLAQLLFLENDLHQGKEKVLQLSINDQKTPFLPKAIADSIPFPSNDLSKIYNMFSIKPDSTEAESMKQTLFFCDKYKAIEGEEKICATSLESMIDFATTKLGKKVKALSTENTKENKILQKYKIGLIKKLAAKEGVVCHRQMYPYAIFYCHKIEGTESYVVSLESPNGAKVKSMAVCHNDTSKMNPKHPAFQVLKVAPGTAAICHFLLEDEVLWVPY